MPKRQRPDSTDPSPATPAREPAVVEVSDGPDSPLTQPGSVEVTMAAPQDPLLEQQLDALEIDDDFRDSIRAMTPNTRRDILNDIIRQRQHANVEQGLHEFGVGAMSRSFFTFGEAEEGEEDAEEEVDYNDEYEEEPHDSEEEVEEVHSGSGRRGVGSGMAHEEHAAPPFLLRGMMMGADDETGMPHVQYFGAGGMPGRPPQPQPPARGAPPGLLELLQLLSGQHQPQQHRDPFTRAAPGGLPGARAGLEEHLMNLHNLVGMLQQANMMQSMGLDRDVDEMSYEELLELEERIGNVSKGVPAAQMDGCMTPLRGSSSDAGTCAICQEELASAPAATATTPSASGTANATSPEKQSVKLINCPHAFHKSCIQQWLTLNKTCPICKTEVMPGSGSAPS